MKFTKEELFAFAQEAKKIFEVVRLVDVHHSVQYAIGPDGEPIEQPYVCYSVWNKHGRCENCISSKAYRTKGRKTKFEFVNGETFFVIANYVEVEGKPFMLELVTKIVDEILFDAYGEDDFMHTIEEHNRHMYVDALTGAYNRYYYEEQLLGIEDINALAIVDLDFFKDVNDNYGHDAGDNVLRHVVELIRTQIRECDSVVRYGGDEFIILFHNITKEALESRLSSICRSFADSTYPEHPGLKATVSVGAYLGDGEIHDMFLSADAELYHAKERRNCARVTEKKA